MKTRVLKGALLFLSLALLVSFYFEDVLFRPRLMVERDLPIFFYPHLKLWVEAVKGGEFPLWNPYSFCGQPLFASLQPAVLYPPNLLLFLFPSDFAFNLTVSLHFFLAGWFVYLLCREMGGSRTAGTLAAVSFTFGGFLISIHNVLNTLQSAVWTPLILFFLLRSFRKSGWSYTLLCAVFVLIQFLGAGIEVFFLTQILVVFLTCFPRLILPEVEEVPWKKRWKRLGVIYGLFFGLGAVQILPFWEMTRNSVRYKGFTFEQASQWSLHWKDLLYVLLPDFFYRGADYYLIDQNYLKSIYLGIIPLLLASAYFGDRRRRAMGLGVMVLFSLLLALGRHTPFYAFLYHALPGLRTVRYPAKCFFLTNLLICLSAGLGWDSLKRRWARLSAGKTTRLKGAAMILALWSALSLLALYLFREAIIRFLERMYPISYAWPWVMNIHNLERFFFFAWLTFFFFVFLADRKIPLPIGGGVLVGLLTADLFLANWGFYRHMESKAFHALSPNLEVVLSDPEQGRVFTSPLLVPIKTPQKMPLPAMVQAILKEGFYFDYPLLHKAYNTFGFGILTYTPYQELLDEFFQKKVGPEGSFILRIMNARFVLWHEAIFDQAFKLIRKGETYEVILPPDEKADPRRPPARQRITAHLFRNEKALPRAFLVPTYQTVSDPKRRLALLQNKGFDPGNTVLLEEEPDPPLPAYTPRPRQEGVRILRRSLNRLEIEASCTGPRLLFLSETYYPGWRAWVNGKAQKIYRADHAFRAVALPAGRHRVVLEYRPLSFYCGSTISGLTALSLIGWMVLRRSREK